MTTLCSPSCSDCTKTICSRRLYHSVLGFVPWMVNPSGEAHGAPPNPSWLIMDTRSTELGFRIRRKIGDGGMLLVIVQYTLTPTHTGPRYRLTTGWARTMVQTPLVRFVVAYNLSSGVLAVIFAMSRCCRYAVGFRFVVQLATNPSCTCTTNLTNEV